MKEIPRFDYEGTLKKLKNRESVSEQDVNTEIINSVLEDVLGYSHIQRESQDKGQRPDFLCFRDDNSLDLIVEGKPLDTDLDKRPSRSDAATRIPKVQLEEYVKKYRFSDDGVFGLLSNGEEWRVCQRRELDVVWLTSKKADTYEDLKHALNPLIHRGSSRILRKFSNKDGFNLLDKIRHSVAHDDLLMQMAEPEATLEPHTNWLSSIEIVSKSNSDGISPNSYLVSIKSRADDGIIAVQDIHDALKETYLYDESIEVAGLAVEIDQEDGRCSVCRIFAWDGGKLVTSAPFDPELPGTLVLEHLEMLTRYANQGISDLVNSLNANPIRSKFYDDLAEWFKRTGTELDDLRHLVRILFTWFLKEKGVIPSEVFEKNSGISVHDQLVHLFTRILPVEENLRRHPIEYDVLEQAYADSPFLNGSLFSEEDGLLRSPLRDIDYLGGEGTNRPGLFTILKRYEWTLTEHTQVHSDIALDPSMIGSVFERFLAIATEVDIGPLARQPDGAYYTPKDLTEEMVCDALAHSSVEQVQGVEFDDMLNIIRYDGGGSTDGLDARQSRALIEHLRAITVLDPCTGSGQFIVSTLNILRRTERRILREEYNDQERIKYAIENQLYGVDIHPIAVQITRFRFYLALINAQLSGNDHFMLDPLINLETRIVSANSLATRVNDQDDNDLGIHLTDEHLQAWREIRDKYMHAHGTREKNEIRVLEAEARKKIKEDLKFPHPSVTEWLDSEFLGSERVVTKVGLRLLFGRNHWDIVVGNPPYENTSKNTDAKISAKENGYQSHSCGDLYTLFVELCTNLIKDGGGVFTMVVPHSICFAKAKRQIREICLRHAKSVHLRTYNNRPVAVFPPHPFIKGGSKGSENVQRVTVISLINKTSVEAERGPTLYSSCYIGLRADIRKEILGQRPSAIQPDIERWTMAGSNLLVKLLTNMYSETGSLQQKSGPSEIITYPPTAGYFLTCIPDELLASDRRKSLKVPNDENYWPYICLLNSGVFHAYWLMVGDAFDVTKSTFDSLRFPPKWVTNEKLRQRAEAIGREFCSEAILEKSRSVLQRDGKEFPNYNFVDHVPDLVHAANEICIEGYDLSQHKRELEEQIEKLRRFETWEF